MRFTLTVYRQTGDVRTTQYREAEGRLVAKIDPRARVLALSAPGRETNLAPVEFQSPGSLDLGNLFLFPAITVRGRVVDAETGQPLAGVRVDRTPWPDRLALAAAGINWRPDGFLDTTDAKGTFALHGLPTRGSRVFALAEGYRGRVLALERDQGDITFELHPPAAIEGTLATEVGLPAAGTVWLSRDADFAPWNLATATAAFHPTRQQVGSDGRFRFEDLQSGSYTLAASSPQGAVEERKVTIGDEDPSQRVMMLVEHAGSISGTVSGLREGETVAVSVVPEAAAGRDLFVTDVGNGGYTLAGVQDGPARVRATTKSRTGFRSS